MDQARQKALQETKEKILIEESMGLPGEEKTVYVGRKPMMNYVLAVLTAFHGANAEEVVLKARGRAISRAVDIAEISKRRFLEGVKIDKIEIGSENITVEEENRVRTVSTIEITLKRSKAKQGRKN